MWGITIKSTEQGHRWQQLISTKTCTSKKTPKIAQALQIRTVIVQATESAKTLIPIVLGLSWPKKYNVLRRRIRSCKSTKINIKSFMRTSFVLASKTLSSICDRQLQTWIWVHLINSTRVLTSTANHSCRTQPDKERNMTVLDNQMSLDPLPTLFWAKISHRGFHRNRTSRHRRLPRVPHKSKISIKFHVNQTRRFQSHQ